MELRKNVFCRHYDGRKIMQDKTHQCKAEINVREIVGGEQFGWLRRMPCNAENCSSVKCSKFDLKTEEEFIRDEEEFQKHIDKMVNLFPLMSKLKKENKEGGNGEVDCPLCNKKLFWGVSSYNGHCHLRCETENCVNIME